MGRREGSNGVRRGSRREQTSSLQLFGLLCATQTWEEKGLTPLRMLKRTCTSVLPKLTDSWKYKRYKIPFMSSISVAPLFITEAFFNIWLHKKTVLSYGFK